MNLSDIGIERPNSDKRPVRDLPGIVWRRVRERGEISSRPSGESEFLFGLLLISSFAASFIPFAFAPSLTFTIFMSCPPFAIVLWRAWRRVAGVRADIAAESECLREFVTNSGTLWKTVRSTPNAQITSDDILGLVSLPVKTASRYAKFLIEDVSDGRLYIIDAKREDILRPARDEFEGRYREAFSYSNLSIKVGILGTFLGFIIALSKISDLFSTGAESQGDVVAQVLQNLAFAFIKSVNGLVVAIIVSIAVAGVRRPLEALYVRFDEAWSYGKEFVNRMALADSALQTTLFQVRDALRSTEQRLFDHGTRVDEALKNHGKVVSEQTRLFSDAADDMLDAQKSWSDALQRLEEAAGIAERRTIDVVSKIDGSLEAIGTRFGEAAQNLSSSTTQFSGVNDAFLEASANFQTAADRTLGMMQSQILGQDDRFARLATIAQAESDAVERQTGLLDGLFRSAEQRRASEQQTLSSLNAAVERLNKTLLSRKPDSGRSGSPFVSAASGFAAMFVVAALSFYVGQGAGPTGLIAGWVGKLFPK